MIEQSEKGIRLSVDLLPIVEAFGLFTEVEPEARRFIRSQFSDLGFDAPNNAQQSNPFLGEISSDYTLRAMTEFLEKSGAKHPLTDRV